MDRHWEHDERYERADDWFDAVSALWNSWEPGALLLDEQTGVFADHEKVHHVNHVGRYHRTRGPLNTVPGPQHRPVVCQAGGSPRGRAFGARNADTIISQAASIPEMAEYRMDIAKRAVEFGRNAEDVRVFFGLTTVLGDTRRDAVDRHERMQAKAAADLDARLASMSYVSGIDFGAFDLDEPLPEVRSNAAQSVHAQNTRGASTMTLRELAGRPGQRLEMVGTPDEVAGMMAEAEQEIGGGGFLFSNEVERRTVMEITDGLIPELRRRGLVRDGYSGSTLREHLRES
jgi:long-chain alkane monooxygenase